jgi:hypothetical protein
MKYLLTTSYAKNAFRLWVNLPNNVFNLYSCSTKRTVAPTLVALIKVMEFKNDVTVVRVQCNKGHTDTG